MKSTRCTKLTKDAQDILTGLLLGDGTIEQSRPTTTPRFSFATTHKEYVDHVMEVLPFEYQSNALIPRKGKINNIRQPNGNIVVAHTNDYFEPRTLADNTLHEFREKWYPSGRKIVPVDIKLTPLSILHWFYGDGFTTFLYDRRGAVERVKVQLSLCTNGFTVHEVEMLQQKLKDVDTKLDFYITLRFKTQPVLRTGREETVRTFLELLEPHHKMACFDYKWKRPINSNTKVSKGIQ